MLLVSRPAGCCGGRSSGWSWRSSSGFRTALTEDLETRRKRSVWWAIDMRREHWSEDRKAKVRARRVERGRSRKELSRIGRAKELEIAARSEDKAELELRLNGS